MVVGGGRDRTAVGGDHAGAYDAVGGETVPTRQNPSGAAKSSIAGPMTSGERCGPTR